MTYVDGFIIPIPKKNLKAYKRMALFGKKSWMKHGALDYKECVGEDFKVQPGCGLAFPRLAKAKPGETVVFAYIVFKSKAHRNAVNARVIKEMEKMDIPKGMPFDVNRMAYGGFSTIVEA